MAAKVQVPDREVLSLRPASSPRSMNKDFQIRFTAIFLTLLTASAIVLAWINFQKERAFQVPNDGAWWVERNGTLLAERVEADGPAARAGIKVGDRLTAIDDHEISATAGLMRELYRVGAWSKAKYSVVRKSVPVDVEVIPAPAERSQYNWLRLIALIYLGIGVYVLLRRWTAPSSTHFYLFCLVSFIFYAFHYSGKFNAFDWTIYWGNVVAGLLQPALFLHFVLTFPERRAFVRKHSWAIPAVYVPAVALLIVHVLSLRMLQASGAMSWNLDRLEMGYLASFFVIAAGLDRKSV